MKVHIDTKEQNKIQQVISYYESHKDKYEYIESVTPKHLIVGDTSTNDGVIGIERKSPADFIPSIIKGTLQKQLIELKQNYQIPLLVVEGYDGLQDCILKNPDVHPNTIIGMTTSSLTHYGVPIQFVGGFYEPFILGTINKLYDGKHFQRQNDYTPFRRAISRDDELLNIVIGIQKVGVLDGRKLLHAFDNRISNIVNASLDDIMKIPGFGKKKAKHIVEILK